MDAAADLAERFASGELRTTNMQNLLIVNVPRLQADDLARELGEIGLPVHGSPFFRGAIACSGSEFCKLAITETKTFSRWPVSYTHLAQSNTRRPLHPIANRAP